MSKIAVKAENISKQYRLGEIGTGTISHDLNRWWNKFRGREDPFLKIGDFNDRTIKGESDYIWSLKDINFEISQGDAVGIIGRNGAGKSTLLKLLSKVTKPTTGQFKVNGRIASLLEVGTGFHPEMTGRENIYLNGAILGMRRSEIKRKFDEIVDFAGIERFIDTPVKRYSSGMYVRLAFAVAAHLESEILIVDEVLAVGDAEFQKKCLGKMGDVSASEGRTILFVSHNLSSIELLCNNALILDNGIISHNGSIKEGLKIYSDSFLKNTISHDLSKLSRKKRPTFAKFLSIKLFNEDMKLHSDFYVDAEMIVRLEFEIFYSVRNIEIGVFIQNSFNQIVTSSTSNWENISFNFEKGVNIVSCTFHELSILPGRYSMGCYIKYIGFGSDDDIEFATNFQVLEKPNIEVLKNYESYNHFNTKHKSSWA
jgi:lipopolysaccharide transport system ATP-binding protein